MLTREQGAPIRTAVRRGFTLPELLLVIVLIGIVGGAILRTVVRQQRYYNGVNEILATRSAVRDLANILPVDLRGISTPGGDITAITDSSIDFRIPTGSAVVCAINATRTQIVVPRTNLASRSGITAWLTAPVINDQIFVYQGATPGGSDSWTAATITAAPVTLTCTAGTGLTAAGAETASGIAWTVNPALPATTTIGAVVRVVRRAHYSLYRSTDGQWYLGYYECPAGVCGATETVAGPFLPYAASTASGIRFTYYDSLGVVTTNPAQVARIDVAARARTRVPVAVAGNSSAFREESLTVTVALRNRS